MKEGKLTGSLSNLVEAIVEREKEVGDLQACQRFFRPSTCGKRERRRVHSRAVVYENDQIDRVDPCDVLAALFADMELSGFVPATQYLSWQYLPWHVARYAGR
jgi:hypothetical protein